jgi:hypothetical protein
MQNSVLSPILSSSEILELLNHSDVKINKEKLSPIQKVVKFAIALPTAIKTKLETSLSIDLSQVSTIPMRWIQGDTLPHIDKGETQFNTTYLIYLTDSVGNLIVDGICYPIVAGDAHIFSEGLQHSTINTGVNNRLMIGPMSEKGFGVGGGISYFSNQNDAQNYSNVIDSDGSYTVQSINGISSWTILSNSAGGNSGSPTGGPYNVGSTLIPGPQYYLYPHGLPISNVCFPAKTPITTDQGIIPIEQINPLKHTIRNKQIVAITQTITEDKYLVCFEKNALGNNIPCEKTIISKNHLILNKGNMIMAKDFIGKYENIYKVKYENQILYNILLKKYDKMIVNNLICETLHPNNMIAKLYTLMPKYNLEHQCQMIKIYNKVVSKKISK